MTTDSDLKDLISSQDLNYVLNEDPAISEIVNGDMGLLDDVNIPEQYNDVPSNEDYPGPFNFDIFIDPHAKKNWMYSSLLKKMFIISHTDFPVDFKWNYSESKMEFYVRAMPLYSSPNDAHKAVVRCIQHAHVSETSNKGLSKLERMHIMRCYNDRRHYDGGPDRHLSVVVPLGVPQQGMDTVRQVFSFVCKNSCTTGMNRRPLEVVFTLEDVVGNVLGRRSVSVRICSCPKRDKEKEEMEYTKNRGGAPIRGKKRKAITHKKPLTLSDSSDRDRTMYPISINVIGKKNAVEVIKHAQNLMAAEMVRHNVEEPYKACYCDLGNMLRNHD